MKHVFRLTELLPGNYSINRIAACPADIQGHVNINDVSVYGAAEMLALGGVDSETSFDAFVRGRHRNTHICVDLERDHVPLDSTNIGVSMDIDSLIWVTRQPHFKKSASVFLGPILDKQAPIKKHNHVYTEILVPQFVEDTGTLGE